MTRTEIALGVLKIGAEIASGERQTSGIRWYQPEGRTAPVGTVPSPILLNEFHAAMCPCRAHRLDDEKYGVWICDGCGVAVELAAY